MGSAFLTLAMIAGVLLLPPGHTSIGEATAGPSPDATLEAVVAVFTFTPAWPQGNTTITFDASGSASNETLQYRWDWTTDGTWDTNFSDAPTAQHAFGSAGTYTVALQVRNATGGLANATQAVIADDAPPATTAALVGEQGFDGWYLEDVEVRLTATDDRSGIDTTTYRLDGEAWQDYSSPFLVRGDGTHALEFQSSDHAANVESVQSIAFAKDGALPVTVPVFAGTVDGRVFSTPINVTLQPSDVGSGLNGTKYRVDGGPWLDYTAAFIVDHLTFHTFRFYSTDAAGNSEAEQLFTVENRALSPFGGLRSRATLEGTAGLRGWHRSTVRVSLAPDAATLSPDAIGYRLDGGPWTRYAQPVSISGQGPHSFDFNATTLGGLREVARSQTIKIDGFPPSTAARVTGQVGDEGWYVTEVLVELVSVDAASRVDYASYRVDAGPWLTYTKPFALGDGRWAVEYYAIDLAGNQEAIQLRSIRVDLTPPHTEAFFGGAAGANGWYLTDVSIHLVASDASSGPRTTLYRVDSDLYQPYGDLIWITTSGRHVLEFASVDRAGNLEALQVVDVNIEKSTPYFVAVTSPAETTSPVRITWLAADNDTEIVDYAVSVDGAPFASVGRATEITLELPEGTHVIQVQATDLAGRTTVHTRMIVIVGQPIPWGLIGSILGTGGAVVALFLYLDRRRDRRRSEASGLRPSPGESLPPATGRVAERRSRWLRGLRRTR